MNIDKKLASQMAGVMAIALLVGTSAFAEDRHRDETNRGGEQHREMQHRDASPSTGQATVDSYRNRATNETRTWNHNDRGNENRGNNNYDRNRDNNRSYGHSNENRGYNNNDYRNNNTYRNNDRYRGGNDHRYDNRSRGYEHHGNPYYAHGRISRIDRWNGGFRVYIGGAPYPFFVPEARFRLFGWRVGLDIRLGGYYNPLGYYEYYDDVYDGGSYSAGALRGVVETVDYRRGSFVLRDDISGNFVTVLMRSGDRTFGAIRPGDYVDVAGDWSRNGLFEAYRADLLDGSYYRR